MSVGDLYLKWRMLVRLAKAETHAIERPVRIKATVLYVKAVRAARASVLGLLGLCVVYLFLFTGFLMFHVGLFVYLPWPMADKGELFMYLGGGYVLLTLLGCAVALNQRRWMKMTGADKAVMRAMESSRG